jgi:hypothetical protein
MNSIEVYDVIGQRVINLQTAPDESGCKLQTTIDISALSPGIYFLRASARRPITSKFIVQKK